MSGKDFRGPTLVTLERSDAADSRRLQPPNYAKSLFAAASRAANLGICTIDTDTRFASVNEALAAEARAKVSDLIGKTSREIIGDLAMEIEPAHREVLRTGQPRGTWLGGRVRDTPEFGYWFDYCFPILDDSGRVQQLGVFVVNVTAEKASAEIFGALAFDSKFLSVDSAGMLKRLDEAVRGYHAGLQMTLEELAIPCRDATRSAGHVRARLQGLDNEIRLIRQLVGTVMARIPIPRC